MGTINVAWWNLENRFDTEEDPISHDVEFTAANGWTTEAYAAKRANLAAALDGLHGGSGVELLGVAEAAVAEYRLLGPGTGSAGVRGVPTG